MGSLPPFVIFFVGGILAAFLRGRARSAMLLAVPVVGLVNLLSMAHGDHGVIDFLGMSLTLTHVDKLSFLFGLLFHLAAIVAIFFSLHVKDTVQHVSSTIYVGGALAAVFAGDLFTLLLAWEVLAVSSVFLIWARREKDSFGAGLRYLIPQLGSGVLLRIGIALHYGTAGSLAVESLELGSVATWCLFLGIGIKCAFPGFHTWLTDGYPAGTPTGTVFLSGITTKVAVYAMDCADLSITGNRIADCRNGGILVHRSAPGRDGSRPEPVDGLDIMDVVLPLADHFRRYLCDWHFALILQLRLERGSQLEVAHDVHPQQPQKPSLVVCLLNCPV